jgi:uncharacterized protein (TIGR02147 family)
VPGTPAKEARVDIFDYLNYRAFLRDYYVERKRTGRLSYRSFSRRAGLKSPNYMKLVMDGARNLTERMAVRFAGAMRLDPDQTTYFVEIVGFTQAKTSAERGTHYAKITGLRRYRNVRPLDVAQAEYHSTWYFPAVRELATHADFRPDPPWIAGRLWPEITAAQAAHALHTLLELGLLVRGTDGSIHQGEPLLSTGPEAQGVQIATYHRTMLDRAKEAIDEVPASHRDISSLTLCLGVDGLRRTKDRIQRFRRELLELSTLEANPRQVVQINFQLFPLTRLEKS